MKIDNNQGYIYIYKCVVGSGSDVCKIGISKDYRKRLKQHVRTPYYGFMPYIEFTTGHPIATVFKVKDYNLSDDLIDELFSKYQFGNYEIYSIDYDDAIKKLYNGLVSNNRLLELIKDNYSMYEFLNDSNENKVIKTTKKEYEFLKDKILKKYNNDLPEDIFMMLKDKDEFIKNCYSHFSTGNYILFSKNLILDLNYNKQ